MNGCVTYVISCFSLNSVITVLVDLCTFTFVILNCLVG